MVNQAEKQPQRQINIEFLQGLELVSNKVYPLPGATFERPSDVDPRLHLQVTLAPTKLTMLEHIATVRHIKTGKFFVSFRQTKDAQLMEQSDPIKYPEWLMKDPVKNTELKIYIYAVKELNGKPIVPSKLKHINSHEDWLHHIGEGPAWLFDTLAYFLLTRKVISQEMYGKII